MEFERFEAEIDKRLSKLIRTPIRLVPWRSPSKVAAQQWGGQWTPAEKVAAGYYEGTGYDVIRMGVGIGKAALASNKAYMKALEEYEARYRKLPEEDYALWMKIRQKHQRKIEKNKPLAFNSVDPAEWGIDRGIPDFLCISVEDCRDWFFSEVKGPGDSLHFGQANWFLQLRPRHWRAEVCMPDKTVDSPIYLPNEIGVGPEWEVALAEKSAEIQDDRTVAAIWTLASQINHQRQRLPRVRVAERPARAAKILALIQQFEELRVKGQTAIERHNKRLGEELARKGHKSDFVPPPWMRPGQPPVFSDEETGAFKIFLCLLEKTGA